MNGGEGSHPRDLPVIGVILAGGVGSRAGGHLPKQFVRVAGKPVLQHTVEVFQKCPAVDRIVIVADDLHAERIAAIVSAARASKVMCVVPPGATRGGSTANALKAIPLAEAKILVHDGVRPLVDDRIINDCVLSLDVAPAVDVVIPTTDTIVEVDAAGDIVDVPDRLRLRRGQTPQGFHLSILRSAYEIASTRGFSATDDCAVVRAFHPTATIATVQGDESNMKVTRSEDFLLLDQLFRLRTGLIRSAEARTVAGQCHVVIGGGRGIGAAIVEQLERVGAHAVPLGRIDGVDVRDEASIAAGLEDVSRKYGSLHSVTLTAGTLHSGTIAATSHENLAEMLETNVLGAVLTARAALPHLRATRGQLLLFSSSSYTRGRAGQALYAATKAAVSNLTQGLAEEWHELGVRVNCLSPGRTATEMRSVEAFGPDPTLQSPHVVASRALELLSSTTTGSIVDVPPGHGVSEALVSGPEQPVSAG